MSTLRLVDDQIPVDRLVVIEGATWADYQRMLEIRGDRSTPRLAFLERYLEIMSPSEPHEFISSNIGCLVETYCIHHDVEFKALGSWTLENKSASRGAEPDKCYKLHRTDEGGWPDLAIEVVWTSGGLDKLDVYRKLGVPEVWYWVAGRMTVHVLEGETYSVSKRSLALPGLDVDAIAELATMQSTSAAIKAFLETFQT